MAKPRYTKVSSYVMEKIRSGEWPVGHMLPTELELCEQFGLSRPSVRTALLPLVNDGYLVRVKGKGTFVTNPQRMEQSSMFIVSFAGELRLQGKEVETEVLEFRVLPGEERVLNALGLSEGSSVIKLTRLRYVKDHIEEGPIVLSTSYFSVELDFLQSYDFSTISVQDALAEHGVTKKFTEKHIDALILDARSSRLMCVENGSLALSITSFTKDADGEPVEYCESYYPASRNEFTLKFRL